MMNDFRYVSVIRVLFLGVAWQERDSNNWNFEANHEPLCIMPLLLLW